MKPYKIEKLIKVPAPSRPKTAMTISRAAATMAILETGDSFLVTEPMEAIKAEKSMRDMNGTGRRQRNGRRFVSRRLPKGLRIWRVR